MKNVDFYKGVVERQLPLNFSDDHASYLLHHPNGDRIIKHSELDWFCKKCFGDAAIGVEDALLHGEVIETGAGSVSIDLLG